MPYPDSLTTLLTHVGSRARAAFTRGGWSRVAVIAGAVVAVVAVVAGVIVSGALSGDGEDTAGSGPASSSSSGPGAPSGTAVPGPDCYTRLSGKSGDTTGGATAEPETVAEAKVAIDCLPVREPAPDTGYSRAQFGSPWTDKAVNVAMAGNGCSTRDDILSRDLTSVKRSGKCQVTSGTLADPYTGKTIHFVRGTSTSGAVQIDHLVALKNAWQTGAQDLTTEQRTALANDPINLLAADGPANGAKGAKSADQWLPDNTASHCGYVASQVRVKNRYRLWVSAPEQATMRRILSSC